MAAAPMPLYRNQTMPFPPQYPGQFSTALTPPGGDPSGDTYQSLLAQYGGAVPQSSDMIAGGALTPPAGNGPGAPPATPGAPAPGGPGPVPLPGPQTPPGGSYNVPGDTGGITGTTSPGDMTNQNRIYAATTGGDLMANEGQQGQYYGGLQEGYRQAGDAANQQLASQPGYTPGQESQINVNYGQFATPTSQLNQQFLTPEEQAGMAGDPNAPANTMQQGTQAEGAQLNSYQANIGSQLGAYQSDLSGQVNNNATGVEGAVSNLGTGLDKSQGAFSNLDTAVNNPALAFDPNNTEKQITDAQVQQMRTNAGTTVGNQYRAAEDQLQRTAAAAGNTSPMAIAAANARLQSQEAAGQGDAESNAEIAALQAQQQQAAAIEQQREGATQTQAGMKAGAATTEEAAAQSAAGLAGTQGVAAAENVGATDVNAANTYNQAALSQLQNYGQFATGTAGNIANQNYGAQSTAEQEAAARAAALATNRQGTTANVQNTQYNQGMGTAQATSAGAQTVGNADIAGMNNYRSYLTGEQAQAQTGAQTAQGQQNTSFANTTNAMGQAAATQTANKNAPGLGIQIAQTAASFLGGHKEGGVIEEPTVTKLAEDGPELVLPMMPRYKSRLGEDRRAA